MVRTKPIDNTKPLEGISEEVCVSGNDSHRKQRKRSFEIPDSGRKAITLNKTELKAFKKMSIDFEISEEDVLGLAIKLLLTRYQALSPEVINEKGVQALFE